MEENTQKKRVVSKGQYAKYLAGKLGLNGIGGMLVLGGSMSMLFVGIAGLLVLLVLSNRFDLGLAIPFTLTQFFILLGIIAAVSLALIGLGIKSFQKAKQIEPVVLLTRHTVDQIPPKESLVRGSQEPAQQPEMLLRAAHSEETPPDQLLRPGP